ncbi:MAG: hypothetical protein AAF511_09290, partial [Pseudomonadota bacterium]
MTGLLTRDLQFAEELWSNCLDSYVNTLLMAKSLRLKKSDQYRASVDTEREQAVQSDEETLELGPSQRRNTPKKGLSSAENTRDKLKRLADGFRKSLEQSDFQDELAGDVSDADDSLNDPSAASSEPKTLYNEPLSGVSHSTVGLREIPAATRIAIDRIIGPDSRLMVNFTGDDGSRIYRSISKKSGEVELEWTEPVFLK